MSRSTSNSSSVTGTVANALSRTLSVKTNNKPAANVTHTPTSDVKLFVTNLRLLDLDTRNDWPGITVHTLSSRTADQKQRIGGVEWALFRLFEIWDPVETSQKLQPFFPPLEPLQSLNLRAALYRCLNELKKIGVLGRDSVLRKTMLDECKGEKFYEILALFSSIVLKKVLAARHHSQSKAAVARKLATANTLTHGDQKSLILLAIAHKVALVNVLKQKDAKRRRFSEFQQLLEAKEEEINQRNLKCRATPRSEKPSIPEKEAAAIKQQLRDNWIGNQKWLDTILHGDHVQVDDAFLNRPFRHVWRMIEAGRTFEDLAPDVGLLENLQLRVEEQRVRLREWQQFHERICQEQPSQPQAVPEMKTPKLFAFDQHLKFQPRTTEAASKTKPNDEPLRSEYREILSEMDDELSRISKARHNRTADSTTQRRGSSFSTSRSPARRRKSRSDSVPKKAAHEATEKDRKPAPPSRKQSRETVGIRPNHQGHTATPLDSEATLVGHPSTIPSLPPPLPISIQRPVEDHHEDLDETSDALPPSSPPAPISSPPLHSPPPSSYFPSEPPVLEPSLQTQEEALADQIISSIGAATPSPIKKPAKHQPRLSLMERTRLSMAPASAFAPITESPPDSPTLPEPIPIVSEADRKATLLERTRKSMAAMSTTAPRASLGGPTQKKDRSRKSSRQSLFPVNQFDTPRNRKSIQIIEEQRSGETTPKELIFEAEDPERIFKSRPKIATSPIFSPRLGEGDEEFDEGVTGVDLGDVDQDDGEEGYMEDWENSPLKKRGVGRF
ncbi:hypothetical protein P154DRAFT_566724 [Amniculicola lignicola CBS 123094]|uniref:HAUS augmin-like complex subunit 6 N-terminal domain-containing protein n=1 Tax=Amniculicola lignicola CBS 123094 TaxID=1392246 RepID=A0A6A5W161_9PLEO|nr:hypothetical protein P154DRAFT_566724 [Amniculicola lignicola CBS 123094]